MRVVRISGVKGISAEDRRAILDAIHAELPEGFRGDVEIDINARFCHVTEPGKVLISEDAYEGAMAALERISKVLGW